MGYGGRNLGKTGRRTKQRRLEIGRKEEEREIFLRDILLYALRSSHGYG